MTLLLQRRRFRFALLQPLRTAAGELRERCGWLLRLDDEQGAWAGASGSAAAAAVHGL